MKLKICGLKYSENIIQVAALQPDYMGFIFYEKSKRFVGEDFVMPEIDSKIKKTGVFVNSDINYIKEKIKKHDLQAVQLHGSESAELCEGLKGSVEVIKVFGVDESFDFNVLKAYENVCDYFLFDTKTAEYGGSGKQFDWNVLNKYKLNVPFFLSGGIGLEEIEKVQRLKLNVYALDLNSKFETEPGLKDIEKLKVANSKLKN